MAKHPSDLLVGRQGVEGTIERPEVGATVRPDVGGCKLLQLRVFFGAVEPEHAQKLAPSKAPMDEPHADRVEPRLYRARLAKRTEVGEGREERVLQDVSCVFGRAQKARREAQNRPGMTPVELFFRHALSGHNRFDNACVLTASLVCQTQARARCSRCSRVAGLRTGAAACLGDERRLGMRRERERHEERIHDHASTLRSLAMKHVRLAAPSHGGDSGATTAQNRLTFSFLLLLSRPAHLPAPTNMNLFRSLLPLSLLVALAACSGQVSPILISPDANDDVADVGPGLPDRDGSTDSAPRLPDGSADAADAGRACWRDSRDAPASTGPSGRVQSCSLVGTWAYDVTFSASNQKKMVWSFDDEGRAVGGPAGTNLCAGFPWYGNYTLGDEGFAAKNIRGDGAPACGWASQTTFTAEFSADCRTLTLPRILTDNCTGGALFYVGKMNRID